MSRMSNFRPITRDMDFLMPPSVDEWLPQRHLARFVVEVIEGLDLRAMTGSYRGSGEASYHPRLLLGLIIYGYATGVFSSRALERATHDSVAFRFIAANEHPDHDNLKMVEVAGAAAGGAEVVHGLTRDGWNDVDESIADVHVETVHAFHDAEQGKAFGRDALHLQRQKAPTYWMRSKGDESPESYYGQF